jgi:molybdenum cofactor guanylyltransferase
MVDQTPAMIGLILAGGRGTRMGGLDKASLEFEGEPLARRVASRLADACEVVLVASGDGRRLGWLGLPQVEDPIPDAGPLAGLVAGLEAATTPLVAAVAVDMPFASSAVLRALAAAWSGEDAVVPVADGRPQPLHAVYATSAAAGLRAALERGERSVLLALDGLAVASVGPETWEHADPTGRFARNLNRPGDLREPV